MTRILSEAETILKLSDFRWSLEWYHAAIEAGILTEHDPAVLGLKTLGGQSLAF
jgi:hypothetical protein